MELITQLIDMLFGFALFINALLFIPQSMRIVKEKAARGISLTTFVGFLLIQLMAVLYGFIHQDNVLVIGYLLSMLTCGIVIILALYYRKNVRCTLN